MATFFFSSRMSPRNFGIRSTHFRGALALVPYCLGAVLPQADRAGFSSYYESASQCVTSRITRQIES
jgi:hypothetical protein